MNTTDTSVESRVIETRLFAWKELYNLDILDGSPPCSTFSISGERENSWGKEKVFAEGQKLQRLDDLFFDFITLAQLLGPKVIVAENVKGMILGNAKSYVREIKQEFEKIGYQVQIFMFNAASMGVPQRRERIFFICRRKALNWPDLKMEFNEAPIKFGEIENLVPVIGKPLTDAFKVWWKDTKPGESLAKVHPIGSFFNSYKLAKNRVCPTLTSTVAGKLCHYTHPNELSTEAYSLVGTFPGDYDFTGSDPKFIIGMSVPPIMTAQIATKIYEQWFKCNILAANHDRYVN